MEQSVQPALRRTVGVVLDEKELEAVEFIAATLREGRGGWGRVTTADVLRFALRCTADSIADSFRGEPANVEEENVGDEPGSDTVGRSGDDIAGGQR